MKTLNLLILTLIIGSVSIVCFGDEEEIKIKEAMPSVPTVQPDKVHQVLVYSHASGFKHASIPTGAKALRIMAQETGVFEATFTQETNEFTKQGLSKYDMIIFNNCTHVQKAFTEDSQRTAILDFIKSGKAFVGFHSASDGGMPKWQEYTDMIGGCFAGHPWNAGGTWPFSIEDPKHPVNAALRKKSSLFPMRFISTNLTTAPSFACSLAWMQLNLGKKEIRQRMIIPCHGLSHTEKDGFFTLTLVIIKRPGGPPLCCNIFLTE
jgi:hypothetical protein